MAVSKSTEITALETYPLARLAATQHGGNIRVKRAKVTLAATGVDNADDVVHMVRMNSRDVPISVKIWNTDLDSGGTTTAADVGIWYGTGALAGTVADADAFASASTVLAAANSAGVELMHEDLTPNPISDRGQTMWELAGLSSDPNCELDISLDVTTAGTGAGGTIVMEVLYSSGS